MFNLKRTLLHGLFFTVLAIVPFTIAQASTDIHNSNVQVQQVAHWGGHGGWGHGGWGWGGGIYISPYSYNYGYYPYNYNYYSPYYYGYGY